MLKAIILSFFAIVLIYQIGSYFFSSSSVKKSYIEQVFKDVIDNLDADETVISQYFSPHYVQYVDGHVLDYKDFVQHMATQKSLISSAKTTIDHCLIEGDTICTVHRVEIIKKNSEKVVAKVIAYIQVEAGKIILCDELTHILKGGDEDVNLGSIQ